MKNIMMVLLPLAISMIIGYLIGSVNFAVLICKITGKEDVRKFGSNNAGMTNMLRVYGKKYAAFTLIGDISKGIVAILIAMLVFYLFGYEQTYVLFKYLVGIAAAVGHTYPLFYGFKGGKSVLVSAGIVITITPIPILIAFVIFGIVVAFTKIVSVSSIAATASVPVTVLIMGLIMNDADVVVKTVMTSLMAVYVIAMHWQNIIRLIKGEENKFGKKK